MPRNSHCRTCMVAIAVLVVASGSAAAQENGEAAFPAMQDYAWGFPVLTDTDDGIVSVQLPLAVNRSVTDPELRDAGVYDGDGEAVPRFFKAASDDVEAFERSRSLGFVSIYDDTPDTQQDLKLLFERDGERTTLELETADGQPVVERTLSSYIVDTRELDAGIEALDLYWTQTGSAFIGEVTVEASNDLRAWQRVGNSAIAELVEDDASIVKRRVLLSTTMADFLRLTWDSLPPDWGLAEVSATYTLGVPGAVRETLLLDADPNGPPGERIFSLGGAVKSDRLRIVLPQPNTVIAAEIHRWSDEYERWYRIADGTFYHIGRGDDVVQSSAVGVSRSRSSRFKVVVTRGRPDVPMQLEVEWLPDTLLFVAQGSPPYTLAAGRAADAEDNFPQERRFGLRSLAGLASEQQRAATLGERYALGGASALQAPSTFSWSTLALWLALALGVGFVGVMAMKVLRE